VNNCLVGTNLRDKIKIIASGKIATGFHVIMKIALGADMCNLARPMMFSVGCIQALRCHTNTCPTGVTTQDPRRVKALVVNEKSQRVANYHDATIKSFLDLVGAMGLDHPDRLCPEMIWLRVSEAESIDYSQVFRYLEPGDLLSEDVHEFYRVDWERSRAEYF